MQQHSLIAIKRRQHPTNALAQHARRERAMIVRRKPRESHAVLSPNLWVDRHFRAKVKYVPNP
jgi:hypothetical protein